MCTSRGYMQVIVLQMVLKPGIPAGGSASFPVCKLHLALHFNGAGACPGFRMCFCTAVLAEATIQRRPSSGSGSAGSWLPPCCPRAGAPFMRRVLRDWSCFQSGRAFLSPSVLVFAQDTFLPHELVEQFGQKSFILYSRIKIKMHFSF